MYLWLSLAESAIQLILPAKIFYRLWDCVNGDVNLATMDVTQQTLMCRDLWCNGLSDRYGGRVKILSLIQHLL